MNSIFREYITKKTSNEGYRRYFKNTSWMLFGKLASMLVSFVATAYIARNLGPTNYGELSYALSFVSMFSFIAVLGIDQILFRELVRYPDKRNLYLGSAIVLRIGTSIIAILLCAFTALLISPEDVSFYLILLLSTTFLFNTFQVINFEFQANVDSKSPSILSLYITILLNILKIIVIMMDQGVIYLALVLVLESILYAVGFIYIRYKNYGSLLELRFNKVISIEIIKSSWPLIFSTAFALIYARIDQIMLKNMIGAESVGLYDAAVRLSEVWYFLPTLVVSSLLPAIINAHKTSINQYYSRIRKILLFLFISALVTSLATSFMSDYIIKIVFGSEFIEASTILNIYIWSNIGTALNAFTINYLIIENRGKTIFISSLTGMLLNVTLNIMLIPIYGAIGAAIATLISYSSLFLFTFTVPGSKNIFVK